MIDPKLPRTRVDDYAELIAVATDEIMIALKRGELKHQPGTWIGQTTGEHINHEIAHVRAIQNEVFTQIDESGVIEDNIAAAMIRLAMFSAKLRREGKRFKQMEALIRDRPPLDKSK